MLRGDQFKVVELAPECGEHANTVDNDRKVKIFEQKDVAIFDIGVNKAPDVPACRSSFPPLDTALESNIFDTKRDSLVSTPVVLRRTRS